VVRKVPIMELTMVVEQIVSSDGFVAGQTVAL